MLRVWLSILLIKDVGMNLALNQPPEQENGQLELKRKEIKRN